MSASDRLIQEARAYASFAKLVGEAQATATMFGEAGLPLPDRLQRFLGEDVESASAPRAHVTAPEPPERPSDAPADAIWVRVPEMLPTGLVLAILRRATEPMQIRAIVDELVRLGLQVNAGSIQNIGTKLDSQGKITRSGDGWLLRDPTAAPILHHDHVWGPQSVFTNQEVAAYRRMLELHMLRAYASGLQPSQLLDAMTACKWVTVPITKDIIKMDLEVLSEAGKIRRVGASKKWEAAM